MMVTMLLLSPLLEELVPACFDCHVVQDDARRHHPTEIIQVPLPTWNLPCQRPFNYLPISFLSSSKDRLLVGDRLDKCGTRRTNSIDNPSIS
ncbi:hypothetical protein BC941DRAFT_411767 [Chlamydoabsidia padenii]|nr:hypothetical protein BC941DRAFT_411767 [Chlamydoabsidia padenii]